MMSRLHPVLGGMTLPALLMLAVLATTSWIYWPGIPGPDLLDDRSSVLVLDGLKDNPEQALDYVFGDRSGVFGRSISMATFVAESLLFGDNFAYRKVGNIVLHLLNGVLVTWLLWALFRFREVSHYRYLAVLLGAIWLFHPLFVSTVLYVVQRMAMLSTFFLLLTLLSYLYWRFALIRGRRAFGVLFLGIVFFVLGMASKENTVVALPIIVLLELLWLNCRGSDGQSMPGVRRAGIALTVLGVGAALAVLVFGYEQLADRFSRRPFSLDERLLTQARVVWDYVGQLIWPVTQRMGIYHDDIVVSASMATPSVTLWAVFGWGAVLLAVLVLLRGASGKLVAFGLCWFLTAHGVESTVLPLEMYFEHRNYAPAIGLLLAIGGLYHAVTQRWHSVAAPLLVWLALLGGWYAVQTSPLAIIWSSRPLLNLHHYTGHPTSARANNDMAAQLASHGELAAALQYSSAAFQGSQNKAGSNERHSDYLVRNLALSCAADKPPPANTIAQLGRDDEGRPLSSATTLLTMVRLLQDDRCRHIDRIAFADKMGELLLIDERRRGASKIYGSMAVLENALGRYDKALAYIEYVLRRSPNNRQALLMKLHFATALGRQDEVSRVVATLQDLQAQGKLNTAQQQTLALYLEN